MIVRTSTRRRAGASRMSFALLAMLLLAALGWPGTSHAATPQKTDILLLFDTTGSMDGALDSAKAQIGSMTSGIDSRLPDVRYGVASVRDYSVYDSDADPGAAFHVAQPITGDRTAVTNAIDSLYAAGGGDSPEAYGGALDAADRGAGGLGWRPGARRLTVLVADDLPHDNDLNEGIADDLQIESSPFDTGVDPGPDEVIGTPDDIDWQPLLGRLANHGMPLMYVLFEGDQSYLPYWKVWAGQTGGGAADASDGDLDSVVVNLAEAGATGALPPCPLGQSRDSNGFCATVLPASPVHPAGASKTAVKRRVWTGVSDGFNPAGPCDGAPEDVGHNWRVFKKTIKCIGSGQVFFDSDLEGRSRCLVNIAADIVPVGRVFAASKAARAFAKEAGPLVKELRALKLSKEDGELVGSIEHASELFKVVSAGTWTGRAEEAVKLLLTSRQATLRLEKSLRTDGKLAAVRHLKSTQEAASKLFTAITGIDDARACAVAF